MRSRRRVKAQAVEPGIPDSGVPVKPESRFLPQGIRSVSRRAQTRRCSGLSRTAHVREERRDHCGIAAPVAVSPAGAASLARKCVDPTSLRRVRFRLASSWRKASKYPGKGVLRRAHPRQWWGDLQDGAAPGARLHRSPSGASRFDRYLERASLPAHHASSSMTAAEIQKSVRPSGTWGAYRSGGRAAVPACQCPTRN